ncbi:hypothetical protein L6164_005090 [Bauhinia variegata]|uniref:Uncharacterized protein n=1 Tax=Bauhinia variegata TaxID=167791 RepID=A0ACB9PST0_BAUVA|nr:hypothetical protein L6164_005090 [Bauhinia variegata]
MEMKVSSPKPGSLAPSDCVSDPEEKEVSDDDDDDRNHKHRRREARSQSLERDVSEPVISRPFRKRNKPFGNQHPFRENESQAYETLKTYNDFSADKEFPSKFERRRLGSTSLPRAPLDLSQRLRANQSFIADPGAIRGRGRESGSWNQRDSRFSSLDVASQMLQQGSIPPSLYTGRGLPNVSNSQSASWNSFGLIPRLPNGGLDLLHPIGLQGTLRPSINSSLNMSIPRQRCRDFEERGFCLRGDMCPMEHGVNRIVIEDVQGLSQFNLPVSLPSAHLMGAPPGSGSLHSMGVSTTSMTSKGIHGNVGKPGTGDDGLAALGGAYSGTACTSGADLYDPDQPLWNDGGPETSSALLTLQSSKIDETESLPNDVPSDRHHMRLSDAADNDSPIVNNRISVSAQNASSSIWGRIGGSKNRFDMKEKTNSTVSSFQNPENQLKEDSDELTGVHSASRQGKHIIADDVGPKTKDSSLRVQSDNMRNIRKPSQKALRTLFVNGIPQKSNKREVLLSHFQKFGEVIDIYIPLNSERAFVQFSKREEAEAALKAPDAVMGNRFIRLWWANRDSITDGSNISSGNGVIVNPRGPTPTFITTHPAVTDRGKDIHQSPSSKTTFDVPDQPKPVISNGPKVPPPSQKKLENLEQLKEELRKKQELLDQRRHEFRRQLNKFEKQATGVKDEIVTEHAAKRLKMDTAADVAKLASPQSSDSVFGMSSPRTETIVDKNKPLEDIASQSPKAGPTMRVQESTSFKQPIRPIAPVNRYKLDNRPTAFRVTAPLPDGLAKVDALKEHFLQYGDLSAVEVGDVSVDDRGQSEARITFTTRHAAERAFINGKCWKDHNLTFVWVNSSNPSNEIGREQSPATKEPSDTEGKLGNSDTQEDIISVSEEPINSETKIGLEQYLGEPSEDL